MTGWIVSCIGSRGWLIPLGNFPCVGLTDSLLSVRGFGHDAVQAQKIGNQVASFMRVSQLGIAAWLLN